MTRKTLIAVAVSGVLIIGSVAVMYSGVRRARTVSALIAALDEGDSAARADAIARFPGYHDGATVKRVIELLDSGDAERQKDVVAALASIGKPAVGPLIAALRAGNASWIETTLAGARTPDAPGPGVVQSLLAIGKPALPALHSLLKDSRPDMRALAASLLARTADASSVDALKAALGDTDAAVRADVMRALGQIEDPAAMEALLASAADADATVRQARAQALGRFSDDRAVEALDALTGDSDAGVRKTALSSLGRSGGAKAVDLLIAQLKSPYPDTQSAAALALGDIRDRRAVAPLMAAVTAGSAPLRCAVLDALRRLGDPKAVPAYISALTDPDPAVRKAAGYALEGTTDKRARQPLLDAMGAEGDSGVLGTLCYASMSFEDNEVVSTLVALCTHADPTVRKAAVDSLSLGKTPAAKGAVLAALSDPSPQVRLKAVRCVRGARNASCVPRLIEMLNSDSDDIRAQAALALGDCGSADAIAPLTKAVSMFFAGGCAAEEAAIGLSKLKDERAVDRLITMLGDFVSDEPHKGATAAYALAAIGGEKAGQAIDKKLKDFDLADVTANYARYVRTGDAKSEPSLIVALVRSGDMKMAEDFYWSNSPHLRWLAECWAESQDRIKELHDSKDSSDRPKWRTGI